MAQLWLSNLPGASDEVLIVLEDGVHPGYKVVSDPDVWNSAPLSKFRRILSAGEPASAFAHFMQEDVDAGNLPRSDVKRKLIVNFLPQQASDIARDRTINVIRSLIGNKKNPDAF